MRRTPALDDTLLTRARELTGIGDAAALVHAALRALVEREATWRLARLGGTEPGLARAPRRRARRG